MPVDVVIADVAELIADRDEVGSSVYWPLREGRSVYRRPVPRVANAKEWLTFASAGW